MTTDRPRRPSSSSQGGPRRSGGSSSGSRPDRAGGRSGGDSRGRPERSGGSERGDRQPRRDDGRPARPRDPQRSERSDRPSRNGDDRPRRSFGDDRDRGPRDSRPREDAPRHDDPPVDEDVTPQELERSAWRELKALTKENAEWVAGHLVMASRVIDDDPERAHKHALAAARKAGRIPVARETVGITAYLLGNFALALRELRTYRRLSGADDQLPLMVDCERGLGRPDKALELAGEVKRTSLSEAVQVELAIARSGARLDMGKPELALGELEIPQLKADVAFSYSPALFDSYAIVLQELGREDEAALWGKRANRAAEALADAVGDDDDDMVVVEMPDPEEQ